MDQTGRGRAGLAGGAGLAGRAGRTGRAGLAGQALVLLALASIHPLAADREITFTAVSAHVSQPGSPVRIRLTRWSTDDERAPVLAALNQTPETTPAASTAAASGRGAAQGRGARGRGGRGGRGRGDNAAPQNPVAAMTAAIGRAPTVGYIWTTEVTGYSIKYAYHSTAPDGGERIVLATDRRLGAYSSGWNPVADRDGAAKPPSPADYEFTLVEIRLDAHGQGIGKTSLTTRVVPDNEARTVALEDYAAAPATLERVKR